MANLSKTISQSSQSPAPAKTESGTRPAVLVPREEPPMTWLRIVHETTYLYRKAVRFAPHRMVLRPREGHDIRVEEMRLSIEPEFVLHWSRDVFGNSVVTADFLAPAETLRIRNELILRQNAPPPKSAGDVCPIARYPLHYSPLEAVVAAAYQTTTYPEDVPAVRGWMQDIVDCADGRSAAELVTLVNRKVHDAIGYSRRETKGVQSPAETLAKRTGSCRDQATLLLEALRVLGFPARFASGYLDCRASEAGRASTHAWAEAYLPERGWVGCDPTIGDATSAKHVVVGVSNHPRGVMPITGGFFGEAADYTGMTVAVHTERTTTPPV